MDKFYSENSENIISTMSMLKFVSHSYWIPDPYLAFFDRKVNLVTFEDIFCVEGMFNPCQKNNVIIIKKKKKTNEYFWFTEEYDLKAYIEEILKFHME